MIIQGDQKIVVAGYSNITGTSFSNQYATVARYTTTGSLDTTSFNSPNGYIRPAQQWFNAMTLQDDQQIICAGFTINNGQTYEAYITRLTTDGLVDPTFNILGDTTQSRINVNGVAVQSNGKIIATGYNTASTANIAVRYLGGQQLETATSSISMYGNNSAFISEFLYNDFYATVISDTTARAATVAAINAILATYSSDYVNQPNFNYIAYLYFVQPEFDAAQAALLLAYPSSLTEINQYFVYLAERMIQLLA